MLLSIQSPLTKKYHHDVNHDMAILENEMGSNDFPSLLSYLSILDKDAMKFYLSAAKNSNQLSKVDVVDVNQEIVPSNFLTPSKSKSLISQLPRKSPINETAIIKQNEEKIKSTQNKSLFMIDVTSNLGQRLGMFKKDNSSINAHSNNTIIESDSEMEIENTLSRTRSTQQPCLITYKKKKNENYHCHKYKFTKKHTLEFLKTLSTGLNASSRKLLTLLKPCKLVLRKMKISEINKILYHVDNYNLLKSLIGNYFCSNIAKSVCGEQIIDKHKHSNSLKSKNRITNYFDLRTNGKNALGNNVLKEKHPFNNAEEPIVTDSVYTGPVNCTSTKGKAKTCLFKCNMCDDRYMISMQKVNEIVSDHFILKHNIKKEKILNSNYINSSSSKSSSEKFYLYSIDNNEGRNTQVSVQESNVAVPNKKCLFRCKICGQKITFYLNSFQHVLEHLSLKHNISNCEVNSGSFREGLMHVMRGSTS